MNAQHSNQRVAEKVDAILSKRDEGLSQEKRESRLQGLERVARSIRDPGHKHKTGAVFCPTRPN